MISAVDGFKTIRFHEGRDGENGDEVNKEREGYFFGHVMLTFRKYVDMDHCSRK